MYDIVVETILVESSPAPVMLDVSVES